MKTRFVLLDADYVDGGQVAIRLAGSDWKGKPVSVLVDFEPYFYALPGRIDNEIKEKILGIKDPRVKRIEETEKIIGSEKKKLLKIFAFHPQDVPKIRDIIKDFPEIGHDNCFEYSINFYHRYLIDSQFSPGEWLEAEIDEKGFVKKIKKIRPRKSKFKTLAFDIETCDDGRENKIIMISLFGSLRKVLTYKKGSYPRHVEALKNEKEMIERFVELVKSEDPDIIYGYNSDSFDFTIIKERAEKNKVKLDLGRDSSEVKFTRRARISSAEVQGRVHIDLFDFISNILSANLQTEVLGLGEVSSEILGDEKLEMRLEEILECWNKDVARLAEYCLKDSELTYRLGQFLLPQIIEISKLVGQTPFDVSRMTYSQIVEWYLSKRAFAMGRIIPNQPKFTEIEKRKARSPYAGGFVKEPVEGLHNNVAVLDFRSLYPSIIASHNISPETLNCRCCRAEKVPELGFHFCKKKGFVSSVIEEIIRKRMEIKKKIRKKFDERLSLEEKALKITANATYGYLAFPGSKWYCYECAQSAASYGRFYIRKIIEEAEKEEFSVVYSDTDSVFLTSEKIEQKTKKFLTTVNKSLPGIMELELQGFYRRGLFVTTKVGKGAKKRYALINDKKELTIRGFETVRRDWCNLAKNVQRNVLKMVLEKEDARGAASYVKGMVEKIRLRKVDVKELIIHEQLTKDLEEYEQIGPHVAAAYKMKDRGQSVGPGMVIMFVIKKGSGSISQRAEPFEDVKINDVDVDYYVNNQIVPAAMRVLSVLGVTEDELKGEGKQTGLKRFSV